MSIDQRLDRLMVALTAKERAILVLRSMKTKTPEDTKWRLTMPVSQTAQFNRFIYLMNACNIYLPLYITVVEQQTEQLYLRFMWCRTLVQFGSRLWKVAELVPASKRRQAEKAVDGALPLVELPWDPEQYELSWLNVSEQMDKGIRLQLVSLWEELRSIEIVVDEAAQEFDGEDPLRPIMRGVMDRTRKRLTDLHAVLAADEELELKEPDEETMDLARTYFENGLRLMSRL